MIQIACVKWGTKYSANYVNGLYRAVRRNTASEIKFICVTDDAGADFHPEIEVKGFPEMGAPLEVLKDGCRAKLAIFYPDVLETGLETLFFDLDTAVVGDVRDLVVPLKARRGIFMLPNHVVPIFRGRSPLRRLMPHRYYFGNSSVLAFYPEDCRALADLFRDNIAKHNAEAEAKNIPVRKEYRSDERFISFFGRETIRVFPQHSATKFTREYMSPSLLWSGMKDRIAFVKNRRKRQVAVTFLGEKIKPSAVVSFDDGQLVEIKRYKTIWRYPHLKEYWLDVLQNG